MQKSDLIKYIAQSIGYWDFTGSAVMTGKNITSAMMLDALNFRYLEDVVPKFAKVKPEFFEQEAKANNYTASSTVVSNTGTTLVSTDAIFTSGSVECKVYNSTADEVANIVAYTDTSTVTLDGTYSWTAADVIYLFTGVYTFGNDATDIMGYPSYVGIKYDTGDTNFAKVIQYGSTEMYKDSYGRDKFSEFSEQNPVYNLTTVKVSGVYESAIAVKPIPETPIANGVYIKYIVKPAALSDDADVPRLPLGYHKFIADGAIADLCDQVLNDTKKADRYQARFNSVLIDLLKTPLSQDMEVIDDYVERRVSYMRSREY